MIYIYAGFYVFIIFWLSLKIRDKVLRLLFFISGAITLGLCFLSLKITLPFSGADALVFERLAWAWSQGSFTEVLSTFDPSKSYLISSITAVFYYFNGREPFIPTIINGALGVFIVYFSLKLFNEVWGKEAPRKLLFFLLVAFSPMLTINSAIILRENYIALFILLATINLAKFANTGNKLSAVFFVVFTLISSFFHGGTILYILGLPLYFLFSKGAMSNTAKVFWVFLFFAIFAVLLNYMEFGKIKEIQEGGISAEDMAERLQNIQDANTTYLSGLIPSNAFDILWQTPIRALFFLTKPFIWDIRAFGHAIAFVDALIWIFILFTIYKNRKAIYANPAALAILSCCVIAVFVFAYGTSNYGTAIRHRTKFYVEMLVLAAPFFIAFRFKGFKR
ncbi:hypothetical protein P6F15_07860 [Thiopseudomonas alkaliphila]|uniref:hypothetical protein n=1 Tax=Thiopseudomonas alkaliphila TaxID=1697053 RepID=UPI0035711ABC